MIRSITQTLLALTLLVAGTVADPAPAAAADDKPNHETAVFAAGCFWCAETAFEPLPGVIDVVSGYSGGSSANPTYHDVSAGGTGHLEVVQVTYDPARITFAALLAVFWRNVDPLQANGQFCDLGPQYRSAIFVRTPAERTAAETSKAALAASGRFDRPIVTDILPAAPFYPAETYHQDYAQKNPLKYRYYRYSCGRDHRLQERWGAEAGGTVGGH